MGDNIAKYHIERVLDQFRIEANDERLVELQQQFTERIDVLSKLDELRREDNVPDRNHWTPESSEDPLGAFLIRCDVQKSNQGPLHGKEIGVKDNIAVAGVPMTTGSPLLEDYIPAVDATVVERLLGAGARIVGKTNLDEFAMGHDDSTMRLRTSRNPYDNNRLAGGSSIGSAIAVADGSVDIALGSDTGGSIRLPAAWCGVSGLKPTRGLVSHHGFIQYAKTLDTIGVLGDTLETVASTLEVISGHDPRDERTRSASVGELTAAVKAGRQGDVTDLTVGAPAETFGHNHTIDEQTWAVLDTLEDAGATVQEVSIPKFEYALPAWLAISTTEFGAYLTARANNYWLLSETDPQLSRTIQEELTSRAHVLGDSVVSQLVLAGCLTDIFGDEYYALGQRARKLVTEGVASALSEVDVLACTTIPTVAPRADEGTENVNELTVNTRPFSLTGHPALSVPSGTVDGLPTGVQFVAGKFKEENALRPAAFWEAKHEDSENI